MKRWIIAWLTLGALLLPWSTAAADPVRIEVPGANNLQYVTLWVALGAKLFEKEGLAPEVIVAPTPRDAGTQLLAGKAEAALLPPPMYLGMMAEDRPILLFASLLANDPINLVVRKEIFAERGMSRTAALTDRLKALQGVKVGVAGEPPPRLRALFAAAGLNADDVIEIELVRGPDQVEAFANKEVDALFAHTPYLETVIVRHGASLLVHLSGGEVARLADGQVHALATTRAVAAARPETIAAMTRAIAAALRLIRTDRAAATQAVLASGAATDRELTEKLIELYAPAVPATPAISKAGIVRNVEIYPAHPRAPDFARVSVDAFVAPAFGD